MIANRIFYLGATLPEFKVEIGVVVAFVLVLLLGPLLVFALQLAQAKRTGLREYGTLAERYVREFDAKWMRGGPPAGEPLVGSADIQSLADLGNSYEVVRAMRLSPIHAGCDRPARGSDLAPIAPLMLTMMPFEELVKVLFGILLYGARRTPNRCRCTPRPTALQGASGNSGTSGITQPGRATAAACAREPNPASRGRAPTATRPASFRSSGGMRA